MDFFHDEKYCIIQLELPVTMAWYGNIHCRKIYPCNLLSVSQFKLSIPAIPFSLALRGLVIPVVRSVPEARYLFRDHGFI